MIQNDDEWERGLRMTREGEFKMTMEEERIRNDYEEKGLRMTKRINLAIGCEVVLVILK